jgi:sister chromatid cohesion protein DCC1
VELWHDCKLHRFTIKGQPNEDAVLCTSDKTYALRSVTLSNTVLVVTPENASNDLVIRDQVNEILELAPSVPKLHKLSRLLSDVQYDESHDSEILDSADTVGILLFFARETTFG